MQTDYKAFAPGSTRIRKIIDRYDLMRLKGYTPTEEEIKEVWDLDPASLLIDWTTPSTSVLLRSKSVAAMQESMVKSMIVKERSISGMIRLAELLKTEHGIGEGAAGYRQRVLSS
jgi:hypothetical protein